MPCAPPVAGIFMMRLAKKAISSRTDTLIVKKTANYRYYGYIYIDKAHMTL
jgi:hypothetical protein